MGTLTWKYVKPLARPHLVEDYLAAVGAALPPATVACLSSNNGGIPIGNEFDTLEHPGYVFKALLSYNAGDLESIHTFHPLLQAQAGTKLFPLALEASGDFICYDLENKLPVLFRHETGKRETIDTSSNPELFASLGLAPQG